MAGVIENVPQLGQTLLRPKDEQTAKIPVRFSTLPPLVHTPLVATPIAPTIQQTSESKQTTSANERPLSATRQRLGDELPPLRKAFEEREAAGTKDEDMEASPRRGDGERDEDRKKDKTLPQVRDKISSFRPTMSCKRPSYLVPSPSYFSLVYYHKRPALIFPFVPHIIPVKFLS